MLKRILIAAFATAALTPTAQAGFCVAEKDYHTVTILEGNAQIDIIDYDKDGVIDELRVNSQDKISKYKPNANRDYGSLEMNGVTLQLDSPYCNERSTLERRLFSRHNKDPWFTFHNKNDQIDALSYQLIFDQATRPSMNFLYKIMGKKLPK
tara:strand:- start:996 stop:1451 length:456 start_codon:yes stop_codon:yes gene_type:complete